MSRKVIYKYEIKPGESLQRIFLPKEHKILSVMEQHGKIQMYAIVNIDTPQEEINIYVHPTGLQVVDNIFTDFDFIGTVSLMHGNFVAHIFKDKI